MSLRRGRIKLGLRDEPETEDHERHGSSSHEGGNLYAAELERGPACERNESPGHGVAIIRYHFSP
jgi:hypothetical protein